METSTCLWIVSTSFTNGGTISKVGANFLSIMSTISRKLKTDMSVDICSKRIRDKAQSMKRRNARELSDWSRLPTIMTLVLELKMRQLRLKSRGLKKK